MRGLLRAELRKVFSTRLWWALLIPTLVIALLGNLAGTGFSALVVQETDGEVDLPFVLFSLAFTLIVTTIATALLGVVSVTSEYRHGTAETTVLVASTPQAVLAAKALAAAVLGVGFAAATVAVGALAGLPGSGAEPSLRAVLAVAAGGCLAAAGWGALGVGLAALVRHWVWTVVGLLGYRVVVEPLLGYLLGRIGADAVARLLPGKASGALVGDLAEGAFLGVAGGQRQEVADAARGTLLDVGALPWWLAALVLLGWAVALLTAAALAGPGRDLARRPGRPDRTGGVGGPA